MVVLIDFTKWLLIADETFLLFAKSGATKILKILKKTQGHYDDLYQMRIQARILHNTGGKKGNVSK